MARIVITRPNGETEYAELTTDKAQAGNDRLSVEKAGTTYYAKLDSGVSTHMFVIKPDGRKLYVQKEIKFVWKYTFDKTINSVLEMVIPRTGRYKITYTNDDDNSHGGQDIFKKGDKAIIGKHGWYLQGSATTYNGYYYRNNGLEHDDPEFVEEEHFLDTIEYIGEA